MDRILPNTSRPPNRTLSRSNYTSWGLVAAVLFEGTFGCANLAHGAEFPPSFQSVKAILERHCLECHQPNILKGEFSLATRADLVASGKMVAGNPTGSRLLEVIQPGANGEAPEMPKKGPVLSAAEVDLVRTWVAEGAPWPEGVVLKEPSKADTSWWSLQPIAPIEPPAVPNAPEAWQANPIDRFLYAKMAEKNLLPAPEADRRTLIRRLYFDLLGLPPTIEAIEDFAADSRPDAWERLVDELLASPHYGERWARHWLDIAHYADTHGFERDRPRDNAWRYRDYVIRAFNDDVPYDEFLREQIAGDVLHPESLEAVIATGFLAAGPWDMVGQDETVNASLKRMARADDLDDMVTTNITATMGLTVNCARCHDHKLDPIPQKDYYRLSAVFAGTARGDRTVSPPWDAAQVRIAAIQVELDALGPKPIDLADIVAGGDGYGTGKPYPAGINPQTGATVSGMAQGVEATPNAYTPVPDIAAVDGIFVPDGVAGQGITVSSTGIEVRDLPDTTALTWDYVLNGKVSLQASTQLGDTDFGAAPNTLLGFHANKGITFDLDALRAMTKLGAFRFKSVVGYGGGQVTTRADFFIYVDGALRAVRRGFSTKDGGISVEFDINAGERFLTLIATDGGDGLSSDQVFFGNPRLTPMGDETNLDPAQRAQRQSLLDERARLLATYPPDAKPDLVYATRAKDIPETHVLLRGNTETPGDAVTPGALSCLAMLAPDLGDDSLSESERRLRLAAWITDPKNPLTARVWVNRLWHYHFGKGIVDTPSDFGFGGGRPSHPELLDWLARQLQASDWSTKAMHRLMLTSQAYRQQSLVEGAPAAGYADPRQIDIDNRLLWRMNPRRLPAEALRDAILATAGTLNAAMYGPGFRDFTMEEDYAPKYTYITADTPELWRRSIYRFVVRSSPEPFMTTLDCPNPAVLTPARMTTTTALQSLALLNNEFMLKQAGYFAARIERETGADVTAQAQHAFRVAFGREPAEEEATAAQALVKAQGLAAFCRVLFNANEFVHVD